MRKRLARLLWRLWVMADPEKTILHAEFALRSIDEAVNVRSAALGDPPPLDRIPTFSDELCETVAWEDAYGEIAALRLKYKRSAERARELEKKLRDAEARAAGRNDWRGRGGIQC